MAADVVYGAMRAAIVAGELGPGDSLVEVHLAERYGVSRTPIREAMRRLEQEGFIEQDGRGRRVRTHSPDEILDIYEVRILLEEAAARNAASRRTPLDLLRLQRAHGDMRGLAAAPGREKAEANLTLHARIWDAGHSPTLCRTLEGLQVHLMRYPATTLTWPGRWEEALAEHEEMLEAIQAGRADDAARLAREHMTRARDIRLAMYGQGSDG